MSTIGVLALQGDVREHAAAVERIGATPSRVRRLAELEAVDALIIPGGESTTIDKLLRAFELFEPLRDRIHAGMPVMGSCAGMIMLATDIVGAIDGQRSLAAIPMTVRRNAFGRQVDSSEVELAWIPDGSTMHATFIRAPWVESCDPSVEILATATGPDGAAHPVAVRHGNAIATSFHPEIAEPGAVHDDRVHRLLLELV
ncbi:pyridoxal 5'-phosphate synthase glutaminase subunit PdxT [Demequina lignilytica]|uniref:Pyridoxal 5'-phosphate synthase subunit PdxT n=1 Tax=Demequina lignilytica TaxID=3051663 RepID=A0AB35ME96_9MICO|nr:pyridoxal 5'-phosphate synthase glutaminase subunit PdxT [Demequina sp. SYSU T0a273]MDN4482081.1 pyridoxal 5'-phosphate synthase glutaminase subunit PdxT [Demequina sp. SYSU T0a273]